MYFIYIHTQYIHIKASYTHTGSDYVGLTPGSLSCWGDIGISLAVLSELMYLRY